MGYALYKPPSPFVSAGTKEVSQTDIFSFIPRDVPAPGVQCGVARRRRQYTPASALAQ